MKQILLLLFFSIFLVAQFAFAELELENFVFFPRHDERQEDYSVYHIYKTEAYTYLNGGVSAKEHIVGYYYPFAQNYTLSKGRWLRERYVGEGKLLQDNRVDQLYKTVFLATDYPRIYQEGQLYAEGMFGPGTGDLLENGEPAIPGQRSVMPIRSESQLYPYEVCEAAAGQLKKFEQSILTRYPNYLFEAFNASLYENNPIAYSWFINTWMPRVEPFLHEGVRLTSVGAIGLIGRSALQANPAVLPFSLLGPLVHFDEAGDLNKFYGVFLEAVNYFAPALDTAASAQPGSYPYLDWLVENLIVGRDGESNQGTWTSPEGNVIAVIAANHGQASYALFPFNQSFPDYSEGDFALWERYHDELGNKYIKIFFGDDLDGINFDLIPVAVSSCANPILCTQQEFLNHIQTWLEKDAKSECLVVPRPVANINILNSWATGMNLDIELIPGVKTRGWDLRVDLDASIADVQVTGFWNTQFIEKRTTSLFLDKYNYHTNKDFNAAFLTANMTSLFFENPDTYNIVGFAGVPLPNKIGIQLSFPSGMQPTVTKVWLNDITCL